MADHGLMVKDKRACLMIGILMVVSKVEKQAKVNVMTMDEEGAAAESAQDFRMLIAQAFRLFPDGDMEKQVIAFAKDMGFIIDQKYIGAPPESTEEGG